jgi:hypothetical protein
MFNSRPSLHSTLNYMTLANDKMTLHLEIDKDAFWILTKRAAEDQQHVEEWLELYLPELAVQLYKHEQ